MGATETPQLACLKCKKANVSLVYARKDPYCKECFIIFTKSKYRRAIDAFRLELPARQKDIPMLLALSGGISSSVLVDLVYTSIERTRGRYAMPIALHIDDSQYTGVFDTRLANQIDFLRHKYPKMVFMMRSTYEVDSYTKTAASDFQAGLTSTDVGLKDCIASMTSRTSQQDMLNLYRDRLILETAREQACQAILFGDSATSLAAKTLALTAKGRGYALPWETADHSLSHSGVWSIRPLKGLMSTEIEIYSQLIGMNPADHAKSSMLGQATSIDELTRRYFVNLETQFPSLVATVVRTTNKLVEPVTRDQALGDCSICGMSFMQNARAWLNEITVSAPAPEHGIEEAEDPTLASAQTRDLCYGCVVATRGTKSDLPWPAFKSIEIPLVSRDNETGTVLSQFELEED